MGIFLMINQTVTLMATNTCTSFLSSLLLHSSTHLPTFPPTHPPIHSPIHPPTHPLTHPPTHPPTHPSTHPPTLPHLAQIQWQVYEWSHGQELSDPSVPPPPHPFALWVWGREEWGISKWVPILNSYIILQQTYPLHNECKQITSQHSGCN